MTLLLRLIACHAHDVRSSSSSRPLTRASKGDPVAATLTCSGKLAQGLSGMAQKPPSGRSCQTWFNIPPCKQADICA